MIQIRAANERGHSNTGWLDSYHSFSFADYIDPKHVHISKLRVLNDDTVAPGTGFPPHPHRDMEIISYVLTGSLLHEDNLGHRHILHAGEVQRMTAGSGIVHSETNASNTEPVHFLQIWIFPDQKGLKPDYEIMPVTEVSSNKEFTRLVVPVDSTHKPANALQIHQDASLYVAHLDSNDTLAQPLNPDRTAYLHLARGAARVNDRQLQSGDGLTLKQETGLVINTTEQSEMLLFDLP